MGRPLYSQRTSNARDRLSWRIFKVSSTQPILHNNSKGEFVEISEELGQAFQLERVSRGAAFGDYDNDGDLDVLVANLDSQPSLLRNETRSSNHWLSVYLRSNGLNTDAIGAKIKVTDGVTSQIREVRTGTSFQAQNDIRQFFGLGKSSKVDIEIKWPNGKRNSFEDVEVDRFLTINKKTLQLIRSDYVFNLPYPNSNNFRLLLFR